MLFIAQTLTYRVLLMEMVLIEGASHIRKWKGRLQGF